MGFRTGQRMTQVRTWAWLALVLGALLLVVSVLIPIGGPLVLLLSAAWFLAGAVLYAYAYALFVTHRQEVHSFLAFVRAARGSSLGRDLS